uniref:CHK kinase-like domain-containing protein n=1 Tax=Timema bartmani TaxID=61472 RepID=A0A7R9I2N4_9NEOP|nr:unnamed protein product [Timema bartmani]
MTHIRGALYLDMENNKHVVTLTKSDLEELLRPKLGRSVKVEEMVVTRLTKFGDNFGSTMLAVEAVLSSPESKKLSMVAKLLPETDFAREIFNCDVSVRKENNYVPVGESRVHEDTTGTQRTDKQASGRLLRVLRRASDPRFHATAIAIKLKKPFVFRNTVLEACKFFGFKIGPKEAAIAQQKGFLSALQEVIPEFNEHAEKVLETFLRNVDMAYSTTPPTPKEPFATIVHNDFWTNNMMFRYSPSDENTPIDLKIVDFQITFYGSPAHDILLFLLTSTESGLAEEHFDRFLRIYHEGFVDTLSMLGCDTGRYSLDSLLEEVSRNSKDVLAHALHMLNITTGNLDDGEENPEPPGPNSSFKFVLSDELKSKAIQALRIYLQNGWLTSFIVGMSSGSSISSSPSSSLDSCCSLIISALSRMPQTVMSLYAAMYSSYVHSGANLCHVSSSHG